MRRVLVCGGRDFSDFVLMTSALCSIAAEETDGKLFIIAGGAPGAATLAIKWARLHGCDFKEFHADWATHGKRAGPVRNQQMLNEGAPDLVVSLPGGRGTADMVRRARNGGFEVKEVKYVQST